MNEANFQHLGNLIKQEDTYYLHVEGLGYETFGYIPLISCADAKQITLGLTIKAVKLQRLNYLIEMQNNEHEVLSSCRHNVAHLVTESYKNINVTIPLCEHTQAIKVLYQFSGELQHVYFKRPTLTFHS